METKYHLLTANFEKYNFNMLFDEGNSTGKKILWKLGKDNALNINDKDKCYIFFRNLPDGTHRIVLSGTVDESDTDKNCRNSERFSYDEKNQIKGIWLSDLKPIELDDKEKFNEAALIKELHGESKDKNKSLISSPRHLDVQKNESLIKALDASETTEEGTLDDFQKFIDEETRCFFFKYEKEKDTSHSKSEDATSDSEDMFKNSHETFKTSRGINLYEKHHLILKSYLDKNLGNTTDGNQQKKELKKSEANKLKKDRHNLITLCPLCHKRIHHGKAEDVKKMIHAIYLSDREWFNKELEKYIPNRNYSVEDWIMNTYNKQREQYGYEKLVDISAQDTDKVDISDLNAE